MKRIALNFLLLAVSLGFALGAGEGLCRLFLDPSDYLTVTLEEDDILGYRIKSAPRGYDSWGYRNDSVEGGYDIVAIGDSQTFGNNATKGDAWPKQLERLSGERVYNLSLGGYGPAQYYYLLREKAFLLDPATVITALYLGNDLFDAYTMVYDYRHWSYLRDPAILVEEKPGLGKFVEEESEGERGMIESVGYFLSRHSILYRVVVHGPVLGNLQRRVRLEKTERVEGGEYARFRDEERGIDEGFTPLHRAEMLDRDDPKIAEGLRLTLVLLKMMGESCRERGVDFLVLLIPTKEMVFAPFIEGNGSLRNVAAIDDLLEEERGVIEVCRDFFSQEKIKFVEALPALRGAVGRERIYPGNYDGHPNRNGYRVIAEVVKSHLAAQRPSSP